MFQEWSALSQPLLIVLIDVEKKPKGEKAKGVIRQPINRTSAIKRTSAMVFPADVAMSNLLFSVLFLDRKKYIWTDSLSFILWNKFPTGLSSCATGAEEGGRK